jgi:hypothetical protein
MTVHINQISSDVTAIAGDLPMSSEQVEKLVRLVLYRLEQKQREEKYNRDATYIRNQVAPGWQEEH